MRFKECLETANNFILVIAERTLTNSQQTYCDLVSYGADSRYLFHYFT